MRLCPESYKMQWNAISALNFKMIHQDTFCSGEQPDPRPHTHTPIVKQARKHEKCSQCNIPLDSWATRMKVDEHIWDTIPCFKFNPSSSITPIFKKTRALTQYSICLEDCKFLMKAEVHTLENIQVQVGRHSNSIPHDDPPPIIRGQEKKKCEMQCSAVPSLEIKASQ